MYPILSLDHSIGNALLASQLFGAMGSSPLLTSHGSFIEVTEKMLRMAKKFELLANGILDECHAENPNKARLVLRWPLADFRLVMWSMKLTEEFIMINLEQLMNLVLSSAILHSHLFSFLFFSARIHTFTHPSIHPSVHAPPSCIIPYYVHFINKTFSCNGKMAKQWIALE